MSVLVELGLPDVVQEFLREQSVLTLATADAEGPWAAPVYYVADADGLVFVSSPRSRHAGAFFGPVAGAIPGPAVGWSALRGVQVAGEVVVIDGDARAAAAALCRARYPAEADDTALAAVFARAAWYRFCVRRLVWTDNAEGLGARRVYLPNNAVWAPPR